MPARPRIRAPVGKSGPGTIWHSSSMRDLGVVEVGDAGVDHLAQVVRRDVGGHADGDAARAVDQQVGELGRQHDRLLQRAVVVLAELDGLLVEVVEQRTARPWRAGTRCSARPPADRRRRSRSCPGRRPAAGAWRNPAPCAPARRRSARLPCGWNLPITSPTTRAHFTYFLFQSSAQLVHAEQDAPVHGLEAVAHVGQRARHDHAHGVIEVGALHLVGDGDGPDVARALVAGRAAARGFVVVRHWICLWLHVVRKSAFRALVGAGKDAETARMGCRENVDSAGVRRGQMTRHCRA